MATSPKAPVKGDKPEAKQYTALTPIDCGQRFEIGDTLELDDETARDLLAVNAIEPAKAA